MGNPPEFVERKFFPVIGKVWKYDKIVKGEQIETRSFSIEKHYHDDSTQEWKQAGGCPDSNLG